MGILRNNRIGNGLFGVKGNAFDTLDDVVGSDHIKGVDDQGKPTTAKYSSDPRTGYKLSEILFESDPAGTNYTRLSDPKNYRELLEGFKSLYGFYGQSSEYCTERKTV